MGARLDQHYLVDSAARDAIAAAADIAPTDRVLEIGPGRGILTEALLPAAAVVAVELDDLLAAQIAAALGNPPNLRVVNADFLRFDLGSLGPGPWKVAANLPYAVATPILQRTGHALHPAGQLAVRITDRRPLRSETQQAHNAATQRPVGPRSAKPC